MKKRNMPTLTRKNLTKLHKAFLEELEHGQLPHTKTSIPPVGGGEHTAASLIGVLLNELELLVNRCEHLQSEVEYLRWTHADPDFGGPEDYSISEYAPRIDYDQLPD
jgi:hypothetical protein